MTHIALLRAANVTILAIAGAGKTILYATYSVAAYAIFHWAKARFDTQNLSSSGYLHGCAPCGRLGGW